MKQRWIFVLLLAGVCLLAACSPDTGWVEKDGKTQYICEDGSVATGWTEIGTQDYYFDQEGTLQTGWLQLEDALYYTDETGARQTGWLQMPEGTYYLDPDYHGVMAIGWRTVEGKRYFLQECGWLHTGGWLELPDEEATYYIAADGAATTGWADIDGARWYFDADGVRQTGWLELDGKKYYLSGEGKLTTGWAQVDGKRRYFTAEGVLGSGLVSDATGTYYLAEDGTAQGGWITVDGAEQYFDAQGARQTGWLNWGGHTYYLTSNGTRTYGFAMIGNRSYYFDANGRMVTGKRVIDGQTCYFLEDGSQLILVNPWNKLPDHYETELGLTENGLEISELCRKELAQMLAGCRKAGFNLRIKSANRTRGAQIHLYNKKVQQYVDLGYSKAEAQTLAATVVAVPGTSEHQLGLAVDLADADYLTLDSHQEEMPAQKWLMEHCWEYGFILRYPNGKSDITGIIYEPWHYRYVGRDLALKIRDSGLCLEEYLETAF